MITEHAEQLDKEKLKQFLKHICKASKTFHQVQKNQDELKRQMNIVELATRNSSSNTTLGNEFKKIDSRMQKIFEYEEKKTNELEDKLAKIDSTLHEHVEAEKMSGKRIKELENKIDKRLDGDAKTESDLRLRLARIENLLDSVDTGKISKQKLEELKKRIRKIKEKIS